MVTKEVFTNGDRVKEWRVMEIVISLVLLSAVTVIGFNSRQIIKQNERITVVESNRFTTQDGLAVWQEISTIRVAIASMPVEVPPGWFIDRVSRLEKKVDNVQQDISAMKKAISPK